MNHHTIQLQAKIQVRDQILRSKANVRKSNKFNNLKNIAKEMFWISIVIFKEQILGNTFFLNRFNNRVSHKQLNKQFPKSKKLNLKLKKLKLITKKLNRL